MNAPDWQESRYALFRFNAVVDWVEVSVTLHAPSQPQHVRARLPPGWGSPYVHANTEAQSRTASTFTFRLQDPVGPDQLMRDVQALARPGDPPITEANISIAGIEIAFDAYSLSECRDDLVEIGAQLYQRHTMLPGGEREPRITMPGHFQAAVGARTIRAALDEGWTINAGDQGAAFTMRFYVKATDTRNGARHTLPVPLHRARCELTLTGSRAPFKTVAAWREFRFETLTKHFSWRIDPSPTLLRAAMTRIGIPEGAKRRTRRKTLRGTIPDSALQAHAKNALRRLTRAQRRDITEIRPSRPTAPRVSEGERLNERQGS